MYFTKVIIFIYTFFCLSEFSSCASIIGHEDLKQILQEINYEGMHFYAHYFKMSVGGDGKTVYIDYNYDTKAEEL